MDDKSLDKADQTTNHTTTHADHKTDHDAHKEAKQTTPAATEDTFSQVAANAAGTIIRGTQQTATTVMEGFEAVKQVRHASKQTQFARERYKQIKTELNEQQQYLQHREYIEESYDEIVRDQTTALDEAQTAIERLTQRLEDEQEAAHDIETEFQELQNTNAEDLRPYKKLMEVAREQLEAAEKNLSEIKHVKKLAQEQYDDAVARRDEQAQSAQRTAQRTSRRLDDYNDKLAKLISSPEKDEKTIAQLQKSISKEEQTLKQMQQEIDAIIQQNRRAVENAQTHLYTQNNSLELAQQRYDEAKQTFDEHKKSHDELAGQKKKGESKVQKRLNEAAQQVQQTQKELDDWRLHKKDAQASLDEAEDIHSTPEKTEELREEIADIQAAFTVQERQLKTLEHRELKLREKTRQQRGVFIGVSIAAAIIIVLILLFLFRLI